MHIRRPLWLTLWVLLMALTPLIGTSSLQAISDPQTYPIETPKVPPASMIRAAQPRVSIVSNTQGDAANLMNAWTTTPEEPLMTLFAGQPLAFRSDYEGVIFRGASGGAYFELAIYRLLSNGDRVLLGADRRAHAGSGPRRIPGATTVTVVLHEPGVHQLIIVSRSTARPTEAEPIVAEDVAMVHVLVTDASWLPRTPMEPLSRDVEQLPMPIERQLVVASPRGHLLAGGIGAVENFDQNHGRVVYVRQGHSLTLASAYEFVWFDGAGGMASTELAVNVQGLTDSKVAQEEVSREATGAWRLAGILDVEIPFPTPGHYEVRAHIRTWVAPTGNAIGAIPIDEDVVRISVIVMAEPQMGGIAGLVMAADDGVALQRVAVRAVDAETGRILGMAYSDEDGRYLIDSLASGKYLVQADPLAQNYLPRWWQDKPTREQADVVQVVAQTMVEGIDFRLVPGGVISGYVVEDDPDSMLPVINPLGGVLVVAGRFEDDVIIAKTRTLRDGSYRLDKLPEGTYWVYAGNASWANSAEVDYKTLIGKYWNDRLRREDADPVRVVAGQEVNEINFGLQYAGSIAGRAVGVGVTPVIVPLKVTAFDWVSGEVVRTVSVGPQGIYHIPSLPAGYYRVYAFDERGYFVPQYYDGVTDPDQATPVLVRRGEATKGIDFFLGMTGVTTLKIEPLVTIVRPGDEFTVTVEVADVSDLGAFSFELAWNTGADHDIDAVVEVLDVKLGEFLGSTGRRVVPVGPHIDPAAGLLEYGAVSFGSAPGARGNGVLAQVRLRALRAGETALMLPSAQLTNTAAEELRHVLREAKVVVSDDYIFADVNRDCVVDIVDIMLVAAHWGARRGDPEYDPRYDLDSDGDIDIVDLSLVAAAWGNTCDQEPMPIRPTLRGAGPAMAGASLRLEPAVGQGTLGQSVVLEVWIDDALDLGAFQIAMRYDATKVALANNGVSLGSFIESSGRSATLLDPQIEVEGSEGTVTVGAFTLGSSIPGADGSGALVRMAFAPVASGEAAFDLLDVKVTDTTGQTHESLALAGGSVTITSAAGGVSFLPLISR
jgi:hypothetical protein